ncbi:phage holin family protein [Rhodococcus sp. 06-221-2]|uniref:phage holin family protein n=1 Tax=Rhodococcus sp. 06-221-2 TaxID=2022514 RepID=UPI00117BCFAE|nr:phage holin family protein [Rhodococcus sp. 06-221-2]
MSATVGVNMGKAIGELVLVLVGIGLTTVSLVGSVPSWWLIVGIVVTLVAVVLIVRGVIQRRHADRAPLPTSDTPPKQSVTKSKNVIQSGGDVNFHGKFGDNRK